MSILLDALKKSEQERQLGQTPTLHTQAQDPVSSRRPGNPWIIVILVTLSAGVMAWFGWQQLRPPQSAETPEIAAQASQDGAAPVSEEPQPRTMTEKYQSATTSPPVPGAGVPGQKSSRPKARAQVSRSVIEFTKDKDSAQAAAQPVNKRIVAEPPPKQPAAAAGTAADEGLAGSPKDDQTKTLEPHVSEPIGYWELPQGVRDNLGEIKITVLVYSERPADRFLLSNGQRLVENDELDGGLVLEEIRRDGAVFLYRNYRFIVKG